MSDPLELPDSLKNLMERRAVPTGRRESDRDKSRESNEFSGRERRVESRRMTDAPLEHILKDGGKFQCPSCHAEYLVVGAIEHHACRGCGQTFRLKKK
ncbi:hypothetical protein [Rubinisphaera sp.]|uniref:hypothetical protein n=1 Tax=Rubinisphaera sp. TaxID=2024857 RepID=UPI000C0D7A56|nr:hypothetical protein [Rubinisphaera sp.]MBV08343.1 hypothetical protein [Rubinisphaera sp.]HCS53448.1 hypothetical protein [Planctomycetaceae bacterium]|tara:strand:- start:1143 stop:1436 length:294 start_codon:yes stop_codon:yes gene_type:complete